MRGMEANTPKFCQEGAQDGGKGSRKCSEKYEAWPIPFSSMPYFVVLATPLNLVLVRKYNLELCLKDSCSTSALFSMTLDFNL